MAVIASRILDRFGFEFDSKAFERFEDDSDVADYAKEAVLKMKQSGIINGVGNNSFAPKENATRAAAAKIIYGLSKAVGL